jgi:SAM-dependent methyltransferase
MNTFFNWAWLPRVLFVFPRHWACWHAADFPHDPVLPALFPNAELIEQALPACGEDAAPFALPLPDYSRDTELLLFTLPELPGPAARERLFAEVRRTLIPGGTLVAVECLRGAYRAAAYGLRSARLRTREECLALGLAAGFRLREDCVIAPDTHALVWLG